MYEFYTRCLIFIWKALYLYKTFTSRTSAIKPSFRIFSFSLVSSSIESLLSEMLAFASLSLSHSLLYILIRIIEHRKPSREPCHPRGLDLPLIQDDRAYPTTTCTRLQIDWRIWQSLKKIVNSDWLFFNVCENRHLFDIQSNCLRWKKEMLRDASLINWYNALIRRFKKRTSMILARIQNIKYIMNDVKQQKNFRLFAQNFFRIVKTANLTSIHNQLIIAWNNLAWQFCQHIFESTEHTTIREFLEQLNNQTSIWYEMTKSFNSIFRRYSKSYCQDNERNMNRFYFNRNSRFFNILNNAYQEYQKHYFRSENRRREKFRREMIIKVEKKLSEREFDKNANERKFDRNSQNKIYDNFRHYEKDRTSHDRYKIENKNDYKNKDQAKTFITERKNNLKLSKNSDNDNYNQFEDLAYFDFDDEKEFDISTLLTTFIKVKCRQCHASFSFNNRLHQHLRSASCSNKNHSKNNAKIILANEVIEDIIMKFKININTDIDLEYEFKEWQYAIVDISLFEDKCSSHVALIRKLKLFYLIQNSLSKDSKHSFESWQLSSLFKI